jgi:hypothetical protein
LIALSKTRRGRRRADGSELATHAQRQLLPLRGDDARSIGAVSEAELWNLLKRRHSPRCEVQVEISANKLDEGTRVNGVDKHVN